MKVNPGTVGTTEVACETRTLRLDANGAAGHLQQVELRMRHAADKGIYDERRSKSKALDNIQINYV